MALELEAYMHTGRTSTILGAYMHTGRTSIGSLLTCTLDALVKYWKLTCALVAVALVLGAYVHTDQLSPAPDLGVIRGLIRGS